MMMMRPRLFSSHYAQETFSEASMASAKMFETVH